MRSLRGFTPLDSKHLTGFTLVELMVVVLIFSLILLSIYGVLSMGKTSFHTGDVQITVQQEARRAMDGMVKELRAASSIDQSTFTADVSENILRFTLWEETIEYILNDSQLQRTVGEVTSVLANDVQNVQFNLLGGKVLYITLSTQKRTPFRRFIDTTLSSEVVLRRPGQ